MGCQKPQIERARSIDTDILVDYLRGLPQAIKFLEKILSHSNCYISAITVAELYAGVREGQERNVLEQFLQIFEILPIENNIAQVGGLYRRDFGKNKGTGLADALIAATAESHKCALVTLNKKHFSMVKNLLTPYIKNA